MTENILTAKSPRHEEKLDKQELNRLSEQIVDSCITVHKEMGPGLLESVYEFCLMKEFELRGIKAKNQVPVNLKYKGFLAPKDFRLDILVENEIVLELKSCDKLIPVDEAQIISYLKLTNKRLGFLLNFKVKYMKDGIHRYVNELH